MVFLPFSSIFRIHRRVVYGCLLAGFFTKMLSCIIAKRGNILDLQMS
jgi:hypothetical protein